MDYKKLSNISDSVYKESLDDLVEALLESEGARLSSETVFTARPEYIARLLSNDGEEVETYDAIIKEFEDSNVKEVKFWRHDPSDDWEWFYK